MPKNIKNVTMEFSSSASFQLFQSKIPLLYKEEHFWKTEYLKRKIYQEYRSKKDYYSLIEKIENYRNSIKKVKNYWFSEYNCEQLEVVVFTKQENGILHKLISRLFKISPRLETDLKLLRQKSEECGFYIADMLLPYNEEHSPCVELLYFVDNEMGISETKPADVEKFNSSFFFTFKDSDCYSTKVSWVPNPRIFYNNRKLEINKTALLEKHKLNINEIEYQKDNKLVVSSKSIGSSEIEFQYAVREIALLMKIIRYEVLSDKYHNVLIPRVTKAIIDESKAYYPELITKDITPSHMEKNDSDCYLLHCQDSGLYEIGTGIIEIIKQDRDISRDLKEIDAWNGETIAKLQDEIENGLKKLTEEVIMGGNPNPLKSVNWRLLGIYAWDMSQIYGKKRGEILASFSNLLERFSTFYQGDESSDYESAYKGAINMAKECIEKGEVLKGKSGSTKIKEKRKKNRKIKY